MSISTPSLYKQASASGNISANPGICGGIFVSAASGSPTITIYDDPSTGTGTKIIDTFTPVAATFYPFRFTYATGLNIVIGGTVKFTVFFDNDLGA